MELILVQSFGTCDNALFRTSTRYSAPLTCTHVHDKGDVMMVNICHTFVYSNDDSLRALRISAVYAASSAF